MILVVKCEIQKGVNSLTLTTDVSLKTVTTLIIKIKNQVKIEMLETKCNKLENEVKYLKEEQEKFNPRIDLMGKVL